MADIGELQRSMTPPSGNVGKLVQRGDKYYMKRPHVSEETMHRKIMEAQTPEAAKRVFDALRAGSTEGISRPSSRSERPPKVEKGPPFYPPSKKGSYQKDAESVNRTSRVGKNPTKEI